MMTAQGIYDQAIALRERNGALRVALSADEWKLEQALRQYRRAPNGDIRTLFAICIFVRAKNLSAEILGLDFGDLQ